MSIYVKANLKPSPNLNGAAKCKSFNDFKLQHYFVCLYKLDFDRPPSASHRANPLHTSLLLLQSLFFCTAPKTHTHTHQFNEKSACRIMPCRVVLLFPIDVSLLACTVLVFFALLYVQCTLHEKNVREIDRHGRRYVNTHSVTNFYTQNECIWMNSMYSVQRQLNGSRPYINFFSMLLAFVYTHTTHNISIERERERTGGIWANSSSALLYLYEYQRPIVVVVVDVVFIIIMIRSCCTNTQMLLLAATAAIATHTDTSCVHIFLFVCECLCVFVPCVYARRSRRRKHAKEENKT